MIGSVVNINGSFITLKARLTSFIKYTIMSFLKMNYFRTLYACMSSDTDLGTT